MKAVDTIFISSVEVNIMPTPSAVGWR